MKTEGRLDFLRENFGTAGRVLLFFSLLFFPIPFFVGLGVYFVFYFMTQHKRRYSALYLALIGGVLAVLGFLLNGFKLEDIGLLNLVLEYLKHILKEFDSMPYVWNWVYSFNLLSYGLSLIVTGLGIAMLKDSPKEVEKKANETQENKHKIEKKLPMDFEGMEHVLATGTTGSGKTANILNYIEHRIADNSFVVVVDGKGGMKQFDLYTVTRKLAEKYGRKLYVLNQTDLDDPYASPYSPFEGLTATQVKDFMVDMSEWESDHYKSLASRYWQMLANILLATKVPMTFDNLIYFSRRRNFLEMVKHALDEGLIQERTHDLAVELANGEEGKQAEISIGRSAVIAEGDGASLFAVRQGWNMRKAYEENAVVVVLLNELNYPEFARSTGKVVVDDIKALVGQKVKDEDERRTLLVLEEFGVYADDGMEGLLNRARSAGVQTIVSLQTFADTDKISPELTRQIVGNTNNFLMMLNNDDDTVERLSKLVGTRKKMEMTRRTDYGEDTGQSSNRVIDSFILHPNELKQIPKGSGIGYFYDKAQPNKVYKFKTQYVEV
jgi:hypothetical protein